MGTLTPLPPARSEPPALHERAEENLRFIRQTMERAAAFTAVSGWAEIGIGLAALAASALAARQTSPERWLATWIATALFSVLIAGYAIGRKARATGVSLLAAPVRRCTLSFAAPVAAAAQRDDVTPVTVEVHQDRVEMSEAEGWEIARGGHVFIVRGEAPKGRLIVPIRARAAHTSSSRARMLPVRCDTTRACCSC